MTVNAGVLDRIAPPPNDPPVFILLASPAWGPSSWLPDTAYQKIPIGVTGQVLTVQADGSINWQNSAAGFANPMTAVGDLIEGGASGLATRLAIGSSGQVLTVSGGVPVWASPVTGFANPMTGTGDLITSTAGGSPVRLAAGSNGQALLISGGTPTWSSSLLVNPMTTPQDLIVGGVAGAAGRLAVGSNGQVLEVVGGLVSWANLPASFANPMTTSQDLIVGGVAGAAARLGVGANGQVLTVASGSVAWANSAAGFANPMTTPQDLIVGGVAGAATRLGVGLNGQVLSVAGGAVGWQALSLPGLTFVTPSGDTTGATDTANIQPSLTAGTPVFLAPGTYYCGLIGSTNPALTMSTNAAPVTGSLWGWSSRSTIIKCVNTGSGIFAHGADAGNATIQGNSLNIHGITVDGSLVPAGATVSGIDFGDFYGITLEDVTVQNWTSTGATTSTGKNPVGAVGFNWNDQYTLTEKCFMRRCCANNCGTPNLTATPPNQAGGAALQSLTSTGSVTTSRMYSDIDIQINQAPGQNGLVIARQGHLENGRFVMRGNMRTLTSGINGSAAIVIGVANSGGGAAQQGHIFNMELDVHVESDPGTGGGGVVPQTIAYGTNADNQLFNCRGRLQFLDGYVASNVNVAPAGAGAGMFGFSGRVKGDAALFAPVASWSPLTNGTPFTNNSVDMTVYITGGTVSGVLINGTSTGLTSGAFSLPMNATLQVNFTGLPTLALVSGLTQ